MICISILEKGNEPEMREMQTNNNNNAENKSELE